MIFPSKFIKFLRLKQVTTSCHSSRSDVPKEMNGNGLSKGKSVVGEIRSRIDEGGISWPRKPWSSRDENLLPLDIVLGIKRG